MFRERRDTLCSNVQNTPTEKDFLQAAVSYATSVNVFILVVI